MTARRLALLPTISLIVLLGFAAAAQACDTWYGPGGNSFKADTGEWGVKSNWSEGVVPEGNTQVCITVPGTYTVSLKPFVGANNRVDAGAAETLTLGAGSGTQTLRVIGENFNNGLGNEENQTSLFITYNMKIAPGGVLSLDATEGVSLGGKGTAGGNAFVEEDDQNKPGHPLINEGTIVAQSSSSHWTDSINSHELSNSGNVRLESGSLQLRNAEALTNTGTFGTAAGTKLTLLGMTSFINSGSFANAGTTILNGYATHAKWEQGSDPLSGNPIEIEGDAGIEDSSGSGAGAFTLIGNGYLLGTVPKGQTITLTSADGQDKLLLGNGTLLNEGTLHLDVPAGSENNTNVEEGSIVNRGTIDGTVEGANAKNVIFVPLTNEPGGVLTASSGTLLDYGTLTNNSVVQVAPSAVLEIVGTTFVNSAAGVIAPQISGASSFGLLRLYSNGTLEAGGTVAPTLVGGFTPSAGEEFDVFEGPVKGSFATVSGGFSADYSHQTAENSYVGIVYGASAGTGAGTGTTSSTGSTTGSTGTKGAPSTTSATSPRAEIAKVTASAGLVSLELTCPTGAGACGAITVKVTVIEHLKKHGRTTTKTVVVASGAVSLNAGTKATLKLHINNAGKALLRKDHSLQALVTLTQGIRKVASERVKLKG